MVAPELFFAEIHSVLNKLKTRKLIDTQAAHAARKALNTLGLCPLPVHHLEDELWKLSQGMSAYDAHYVVLAKASKMPLATCDRRLTNANVSGVKFLVV